MIAIAGCRPRLPDSFPLSLAENSGNMIHARAPRRIFGRTNTAEYHQDRWGIAGEKDFSDFVNKHCDHLIITMTNSIKVNADFRQNYVRVQRMLEMYDVPITIFGLGVRSPTTDLSQATIPDEAVTLLRYMADRCGPIGVRGEFTKSVFAELAGVTNVQVTGCPSFFSQPGSYLALREQLRDPQPGTYTYSGTRYERPEERAQFLKIARGNGIYIEPTNKENHRAHLDALRGEPIQVPRFLTDNGHLAAPSPDERAEGQRGQRGLRGLRGLAGRWRSGQSQRSQQSAPSPEAAPDGGSTVTLEQLTDLYRNRYRLFRDPDEWLRFNREVVAFGFGTRFHVNMATILAGKPATWVTHDTRTREFCDFLHLPQVSLEDSAEMEPEDFRAAADFEEFFDHLPALFDNWASYLEAHNLPYTRPQLP